jgi:tetratricopeptide (TPR) repeat protein
MRRHERALQAEAAAPQDPAIYMSRLNLGAAQAALGNYREAIPYGEEAAAAYRRAGKVAYEAIAVSNIAQAHLFVGNFHLAKAYCGQALNLFASLNINIGEAHALVVLGHAHHSLGELDAGTNAWAKAHDLFSATKYPHKPGHWMGTT